MWRSDVLTASGICPETPRRKGIEVTKTHRKLVKKLHNSGFTTKRTTKQHLLVLHDGRVVTCFAGTPSDRDWRNSMAPLRRLGFTA